MSRRKDILQRIRHRALIARKALFGGTSSQVLPPGILRRRTRILYSWGIPVSFQKKKGMAHKLLPLYRTRNKKSIFDDVDLQLQFSTQMHGCPTIAYGERLYTLSAKGKDTPKKGWQRTSLLTVTSKMTAPSFSLPAGPTTTGGSCVASNTSKKGGKREQGKDYICDDCYALKRNYKFPNVATAQAARYHWVLQQISADPTGNLLAQQFIAALNDYARNGTLASSEEGKVARLTQEFGVWNGSTIQVPMWLQDIQQVRFYEAVETPLPQHIFDVKDTRELFQRRGTRPGEVAGFFRIHDSGGFTPGPKASFWAPYMRAWATVARAFPSVFFWAPSRVYVMPALQQVMREISTIDNLIVRPSALHVDDPVPLLVGMAAGTTVVSKEKGKFKTAYDANGEVAYQCLVYLHDDDYSCMAAGCRVCWLNPNIAVAYGLK
jgi:hypothetical protein